MANTTTLFARISRCFVVYHGMAQCTHLTQAIHHLAWGTFINEYACETPLGIRHRTLIPKSDQDVYF